MSSNAPLLRRQAQCLLRNCSSNKSVRSHVNNLLEVLDMLDRFVVESESGVVTARTLRLLKDIIHAHQRTLVNKSVLRCAFEHCLDTVVEIERLNHEITAHVFAAMYRAMEFEWARRGQPA